MTCDIDTDIMDVSTLLPSVPGLQTFSLENMSVGYYDNEEAFTPALQAVISNLPQTLTSLTIQHLSPPSLFQLFTRMHGSLPNLRHLKLTSINISIEEDAKQAGRLLSMYGGRLKTLHVSTYSPQSWAWDLTTCLLGLYEPNNANGNVASFEDLEVLVFDKIAWGVLGDVLLDAARFPQLVEVRKITSSSHSLEWYESAEAITTWLQVMRRRGVLAIHNGLSFSYCTSPIPLELAKEFFAGFSEPLQPRLTDNIGYLDLNMIDLDHDTSTALASGKVLGGGKGMNGWMDGCSLKNNI